MKILIALNFAVGLLLAASFIALDRSELAVLPGMVLLPGFLVLAVANFLFVLNQWKTRHFRAFIPIGTYIGIAVVSVAMAKIGSDLVLKGTPCRPESFFTGQTKSDLVPIVNAMITARRSEIFSPEIREQLSKHSLKPLFVDTNLEIAVVGYYHTRSWFEYIYSKNGSTNLPRANTGYTQPVEKSLGDNWYFRVW